MGDIMINIRENWNQKQTQEKVLYIMEIICSISIIILVSMQIFNIWENAIYVFEPLLGILMLIQAIQNWKKNKVLSLVALGAAIFIFLVAVFVFPIK